jgi:hypothetical protein
MLFYRKDSPYSVLTDPSHISCPLVANAAARAESFSNTEMTILQPPFAPPAAAMASTLI